MSKIALYFYYTKEHLSVSQMAKLFGVSYPAVYITITNLTKQRFLKNTTTALGKKIVVYAHPKMYPVAEQLPSDFLILNGDLSVVE